MFFPQTTINYDLPRNFHWNFGSNFQFSASKIKLPRANSPRAATFRTSSLLSDEMKYSCDFGAVPLFPGKYPSNLPHHVLLDGTRKRTRIFLPSFFKEVKNRAGKPRQGVRGNCAEIYAFHMAFKDIWSLRNGRNKNQSPMSRSIDLALGLESNFYMNSILKPKFQARNIRDFFSKKTIWLMEWCKFMNTWNKSWNA